MNDENALIILEQYRKDHRITGKYKEALAHFAAKPQVIERIDPLLRSLIWPGDISCQDCQELMPLVLSGIPLDPEKYAAFTLHLKECPDCKLEFTELQKMGQDF